MTFWQIVETNGQQTMQHLERHEPGRIRQRYRSRPPGPVGREPGKAVARTAQVLFAAEVTAILSEAGRAVPDPATFVDSRNSG